MAIGMPGKDGRVVDNNTREIDPDQSPASSDAKDGEFGYDPEGNEKGGRKMSRIAAPGALMGDADSGLDVGRQLELESSNAIKYRTCSWQKVI